MTKKRLYLEERKIESSKYSKNDNKSEMQKDLILQEIRRCLFPSLHDLKICEIQRFYIWHGHAKIFYLMKIPLLENHWWSSILKYITICEKMLPLDCYTIILPKQNHTKNDKRATCSKISQIEAILPKRKISKL